MHDDDEQIGRVLTRREAIGLLGTTGAALVATPAALPGADSPTPFRLPACIVRPQQTEGPYFVDGMLDRSDIRSDPSDGSVSEGLEFRLGFSVSRLGPDGCHPLPDALVDVWLCDAAGVYSGVEDIIGGAFDTRGKSFLRGHQRTDADGTASFTTIYPGWYPGRAVHIHFKIRTSPEAEAGYDFTSQVYFDDALSDRLFAEQPYAAHVGERPRNMDDRIFRSGGDQLLLTVTERDGALHSVFDIGLQID